MEITHEVLDPYFDAALSELADTAAPYGLLRRYSNSGGELTGNPWHITGLLLVRPGNNNLVCEADLVSSLNLCVFRVYRVQKLAKRLRKNLLQKYGINGDKIGGIVLNDFLAFGSQRNPAFRHSRESGNPDPGRSG